MANTWDDIEVTDLNLHLEDSELLKIILEAMSLDSRDLVEQLTENQAETVAAGYSGNLVCHEKDLSDRFDDMIKESSPCECGNLPSWVYNDSVKVNEDFMNYADSLVTDGLLHPEQYENYEYVGEFAK